MGYRVAFVCLLILVALMIGLAIGHGILGDSVFWEQANKIGIIFTIVGTIFTFGTFYYLNQIGDKLKRRQRIPESHKDLEALLKENRLALKDWGYRERDVIELFHQMQAHLDNVSSKLSGADRVKAIRISASITRHGLRYIGRRNISENESWRIQNNLNSFVTLLGAIHQDNEAERL
jgi:hypothetical protein